MIPGRPLVLLLIAPLALAIMYVVDRTLLLPMLAADAGIALVAIADFVLALPRKVEVRRDLHEVLSLGRHNAVKLTLRNRARRRLKVLVTDDLFEDASSEELPIQLDLPAGGRQSVTYHVVPRRRGAYQIGDHHVRYASPLGLWIRQLNLEASDGVRVYPDLLAVRTYELMARQNRELELVRATRLKGGESEFERLREYTRDDEFRAVDWKATARRQQLIAREYQLESNQNIVLMLDAGRVMTAVTDGLSHFDHALNASLMLGHVATRGGDHVGLVGFDDAVRAFVPPGGGASASRRLIQASYDLHPSLVEADYDGAFEQLSLRLRKRSLVVLFTQVLDEAVAQTLVRRLHAISRRHLPMLVLFRDIDVERLLDPRGGGPEELYTRGAAAELLRWRDGFIHELKSRGTLVLDVTPRNLTPSLINRYLQVKARHLL